MNEVRRKADEAKASVARERYLREPQADLPPDSGIAPLLEPGESVIAVRRAATVDRRSAGTSEHEGLLGDLYLTSRRLVFTGRLLLHYPLAEIDDVLLGSGRLLLLLGSGASLALDLDEPGLLRVEIAAARRAAQGVGNAGGQGMPIG